MQFYILVPALFHLIILRFRRLWFLLLPVSGAASFLLQVVSNKTTAQSLILCQMWKFLAGIFAYFCIAASRPHKQNSRSADDTYEKLLNEEESIKWIRTDDATLEFVEAAPASSLRPRILTIIVNLSIGGLILLLLAPFAISPNDNSSREAAFRLIAVLLTIVLLFAGATHPSSLFANQWMCELGDASYIWYLVHWPLIQFLRYFSLESTIDFSRRFFDYYS